MLCNSIVLNSLNIRHNLDMELHERIKTARAMARLSQEELAKRVGVSRGAVVQWEKEKEPGDTDGIKKNNLEKIAEVTGCDEVWLITGQGINPAASYRNTGESEQVLAVVIAALKAAESDLNVQLSNKAFGSLAASLYHAALTDSLIATEATLTSMAKILIRTPFPV